MPEVFFNGPAGRLEGRFHPAKQRGAPIAVVLHSHPQFGGTMNNQIVYNTYYNFAERGFSVLRFNFRGVGRSQGAFDHGQGELSDAASALDWAQSISPEARACWIAGVSFGSWIGMQLLMRRPEIEGFISIAPPANRFDYSFLAPCPSSGLFVHGDKDRVAPLKEVLALIEKLKTQKGISHRACGDPRGQSLLRGLYRRTANGRRRLSRQASRHAPSCAPARAEGAAEAVPAAARQPIEPATPLSLITTTDELRSACQRLARAPFVTVDTEFLRETTFWPILCVVQLASDDEAMAIDALAPRARPRAAVAADGRRERRQGVPRRPARPRDLLEALRRVADAAVRHPGRGDGLRLRRPGLLQRACRIRSAASRSTSRRASPIGRAVRWPTRRSSMRSAT